MKRRHESFGTNEELDTPLEKPNKAPHVTSASLGEGLLPLPKQTKSVSARVPATVTEEQWVAPSESFQPVNPLLQLEKNLYVGNLAPSITEYALIQLFKPFGKIVREQYLWHTAGPKRGQPRGYGFIEYSSPQEAQKAQRAMHGKRIQGRNIVVQFSSGEKPHTSQIPALGGSRTREDASSSASRQQFPVSSRERMESSNNRSFAAQKAQKETIRNLMHEEKALKQKLLEMNAAAAIKKQKK